MTSKSQSFRANYHLSFTDKNHYSLTLSATLSPAFEIVRTPKGLEVYEGRRPYSKEQIHTVLDEFFAGLSPDKIVNYVISDNFSDPRWHFEKKDGFVTFSHKSEKIKIVLKSV